MQLTVKNLTPTKVRLEIIADPKLLDQTKATVINGLAASVKVAGFRPGKAPLNLIEKQLEPKRLQTEFLEVAVNRLYSAAISEEQLRPATQPAVSISKFVPFSVLEISAEVEVVGEIQLPDYKKLKLTKSSVSVSPTDVEAVIKNLRAREADKKEVKRAAKKGDEVVIDFSGLDAKTKEPIAGADGKDYPLLLGSNSFIPGFEAQLIGLKASQTKSFKVTFPKDYQAKALQNTQAEFTVSVKQVKELSEPKLDNKFAAKIGPFKTLTELKADIKTQLTAERQREAERSFENQLIDKITAGTKVEIPDVLVEEQTDFMEREERQNLSYRGQTWQEHLTSEGISEEQHHQRQRPLAEQRIRAGLALSEISEREGLAVTPDEIDNEIKVLKAQYTDPQMQAELDKPENRRDLANRLLTQKTVTKLKSYAEV